jgi:hypothetical protein
MHAATDRRRDCQEDAPRAQGPQETALGVSKPGEGDFIGDDPRPHVQRHYTGISDKRVEDTDWEPPLGESVIKLIPHFTFEELSRRARRIEALEAVDEFVGQLGGDLAVELSRRAKAARSNEGRR